MKKRIKKFLSLFTKCANGILHFMKRICKVYQKRIIVYITFVYLHSKISFLIKTLEHNSITSSTYDIYLMVKLLLICYTLLTCFYCIGSSEFYYCTCLHYIVYLYSFIYDWRCSCKCGVRVANFNDLLLLIT